MEDQLSPTKARAILARYGLQPKKAFGQNFLLARGVTEKIVAAAALTPGEVVVEIGPGLGVLTRALAGAGARVIAVEIDRSLMPVLSETLADLTNVEMVNEDALKVDYGELLDSRGLDGPFKVVANLPYYITTPLIARLLEQEPRPRMMVLMVQKEVADRLVAVPGTKEYGALSVMVQYYAVPRLVCRIAPGSFFPPPKVDSTVIRIDVRDVPAVRVQDAKALFRVVRGAFGQRRKTLPRALENARLGLSHVEWSDLLRSLDIDPVRRGETLSLDDFGRLANAWVKLQHEHRVV